MNAYGVPDARRRPPTDQAIAGLAEIWRKIIGPIDVEPTSNWFARDVGSRTALLVSAIHDRWDVRVPLSAVYRSSILRDLAAVVSGEDPLSASIADVVELRTGSREPVLVYVPGAYGEDLHALVVLQTLRHRVLFLRSPGLDEGGVPLRSIPELADHFLRIVEQELAGRPAVFAGFSSGGLVAVEMARRTTDRQTVRKVVLIDTFPPLDGLDELDEPDFIGLRLHELVQRAGNGLDPAAPSCMDGDLTPDKIEEITQYLHAHDSPFLPYGVPWAYLERRLHVSAAGMIAANAYSVTPCAVPVAYLRTPDGRDMEVSWQHATTTDEYEVVDVDRTHSSLWDDLTAADVLTHFLDTADGEMT